MCWPRSAGLKQGVNPERTTPPTVTVPLTQRAFDSFVWTHTLASNRCFSFLVYPHKAHMHHAGQAAHMGSVLLTNHTKHIVRPRHSPFSHCMQRSGAPRLWPNKRHSFSAYMEINTAIIKTHGISVP